MGAITGVTRAALVCAAQRVGIDTEINTSDGERNAR